MSREAKECKPLIHGPGGRYTLHRRRRDHIRCDPGKAVQVDPMRPTLKAPGIRRFKSKIR